MSIRLYMKVPLFLCGLYFIYVDYLILDLFKLLYVYICHFPTSF